MALPFLNKKNADPLDEYFETNHKIIAYDNEKHTCEIYTVTGFNATSVMCEGRFMAPLEDCIIHISEMGRVYTINAPTQYITEAKRLAELEKSLVLGQLVNYKEPPIENPNMDLFKWALIFLLFIAFIVSIF